MTEVPDWAKRNRSVRVKGRKMWMPPSERRVAERVAIHTIMMANEVMADRIEAVIEYYRAKYSFDRSELSHAERRRLFVERGGQCMWCHLPLRMNFFTVEHVKSLADGGTSDWDNLGIAHEECNNGREHDTWTRQGHYRPLVEAARVEDAIEPYEPKRADVEN